MLYWRAPLLPDPVRTPGPVQTKKLGRWRKNSAASRPPPNHLKKCTKNVFYKFLAQFLPIIVKIRPHLGNSELGRFLGRWFPRPQEILLGHFWVQRPWIRPSGTSGEHQYDTPGTGSCRELRNCLVAGPNTGFHSVEGGGGTWYSDATALLPGQCRASLSGGEENIVYFIATQLHCFWAICKGSFSGGSYATALLLGQMQSSIQWGGGDMV